MTRAVFLGLSVISSTFLVLSLGQRPFPNPLKHPNHNYYPNGTLADPRPGVQYTAVGETAQTWGYSPAGAPGQNPAIPASPATEERKIQDAYKTAEWASRAGQSTGDQMLTSESAVYESIVHAKTAKPVINIKSMDFSGDLHDSKHPQGEEDIGGVVGSQTPPRCAETGRYYCSYKEEYPLDVVTQVTKFLKWPLEKLFRDLKQAKLPKIAESNQGSLVCDSVSRVVRPGWAKNTNGRWLVVINTDNYQQYITEVVCRYDGAFCNFIPPCYHATCQQRYNTQSLLVVDPLNPYKGPFMSQFLFPSCCVCFIPNTKP